MLCEQCGMDITAQDRLRLRADAVERSERINWFFCSYTCLWRWAVRKSGHRM